MAINDDGVVMNDDVVVMDDGGVGERCACVRRDVRSEVSVLRACYLETTCCLPLRFEYEKKVGCICATCHM